MQNYIELELLVELLLYLTASQNGFKNSKKQLHFPYSESKFEAWP